MRESAARALKEHQKRVLIRAWELRQFEHAKGSWYRLRRALAMSQAVYAVDDEDASMLEQRGLTPLAVGAEFAPAKRLFVVDQGQLSSDLRLRPLRMRLNRELLAAKNLVLVPWSSELTP